MDLYTRFNTKNIQDRQIDTLIGISKGMLADGVLVQAEVEFLQTWLVQNSFTDNPVILNLLDKVDAILSDGLLDKNEAAELFKILQKFTGDECELGELTKTSSLPVNDPMPKLDFPNHSFLFTGTCAYGTRKQCEEAIITLGGSLAKGVNKSLDYLILGSYVTDSWAHESFGRKIEKAMEYRQNGIPLVIVTEDHWVRQAGL